MGIDLYCFRSPGEIVERMNGMLDESSEKFLDLGEWKEKGVGKRGRYSLLSCDSSRVLHKGSVDLILPHKMRLFHISEGSWAGRICADVGLLNGKAYANMSVSLKEKDPFRFFGVKLRYDCFRGRVDRCDWVWAEHPSCFAGFGGEIFGSSCFVKDEFAQV